MQNHSKIDPGHVRHIAADRAFTVIELMTVMATVLLLLVLILPILARTETPSRLTTCTANFHQWTVAANLYATEDLQGRLPSFDPAGGGLTASDVGTNLVPTLAGYGMTLTSWFCPMRPAELNAANAWAVAVLGHSLTSAADVNRYFTRAFPGEAILNNNYWVPRAQVGSTFPVDYSLLPPVIVPAWAKGTDPSIYGWPKTLYSRAAALVPFVSDLAASSTSTNVAEISPNTAHFVHGALLGGNAAFIDGHVQARSRAQMRAVYFNGSTYWFY